MQPNATFYAFKPSGKWKYEGRGVLTDAAMLDFDNRKAHILSDNNEQWPGCNSPMHHMICVVIPDEDCAVAAFPLMFRES